MAESRTTKKLGFSDGLPVRETVGRRTTPPADGTQGALDEDAFLGRVEADLGDEENRRKVRGILKGVAFGALLWILLVAVVIVATQ